MADIHLIRFLDGPMAGRGDATVPIDHFGWPLPAELAVFDGGQHLGVMDGSDGLLELVDPPPTARYRKVKESQLPSDDIEGMARGAEYEVIP